MTLLKSKNIDDIAHGIETYDAHLQAITGSSLLDIACLAAGVDRAATKQLCQDTQVICVSTTCGQGKIEGFTESLACIAVHLGFEAHAVRQTDVAGLAEAYENQADIILTADDNRFIAINTGTRIVVDNVEATGKGFVRGLDRMVGGLEGEQVLVLGCGPVGQSACLTLLGLKANVSLFDIRPWLCRDFVCKITDASNYEIEIEPDLKTALQTHSYIIDATPTGNIIDDTAVTSQTYISAPGVPCGVSDKAKQMLRKRIIHDPLQIGVATMLLLALKRY